MQLYGDFGFYYFDAGEYPYFALIWAKSTDDALKTYRDEVCEEDDGEEYGAPEKLSFKKGLKEIMDSTSEDEGEDDSEAFYVLRSLFTRDENQVILVSSDLI